MEIPGTCHVCGTQALVRTCMLCGQQVCRAHFDLAASSCIRCTRRAPRRGGGSMPDEPPDLPPPEDIGDRLT